MKSGKIENALKGARDVADIIHELLDDVSDLDLQRLLKQVEADLMDVQHKLAIAVKLAGKS